VCSADIVVVVVASLLPEPQGRASIGGFIKSLHALLSATLKRCSFIASPIHLRDRALPALCRPVERVLLGEERTVGVRDRGLILNGIQNLSIFPLA
jgi:hypothetical protein